VPEAIDGLLCEFLRFDHVRHIGLNRDRLDALVLADADRFERLDIIAEVIDDDVRSSFRQSKRRRSPDTARCARDDRGLAGEEIVRKVDRDRLFVHKSVEKK
jgi:hypothetical protein